MAAYASSWNAIFSSVLNLVVLSLKSLFYRRWMHRAVNNSDRHGLARFAHTVSSLR